MLLGAWPIGGVKHNSLSNSSETSGKCRFIILCGCYGLFLIIGAAIFSAIEAPQLDKLETEFFHAKEKFIQRNPCLNSKCLSFALIVPLFRWYKIAFEIRCPLKFIRFVR